MPHVRFTHINQCTTCLIWGSTIDFYVLQEDSEKAKKVIEDAWHVEMDKGGSAKHYDFKHNGITYEMHFRLFEWHQEKKERYWQEILHNAMNYRVKIGVTQVAALEPTVHTLYVFMHLYHHLIEMGGRAASVF